jgi:hypothetical protein
MGVNYPMLVEQAMKKQTRWQTYGLNAYQSLLEVFWEEIAVRSIHGAKTLGPNKQKTQQAKDSGADTAPQGEDMEPA